MFTLIPAAPIRAFLGPARLGERGVLVARKRAVTQQVGKMAGPSRAALQMKPLVAGIHLKAPNFIPRTLIGLIWNSSGNAKMNANMPSTIDESRAAGQARRTDVVADRTKGHHSRKALMREVS